MHGERVANDAVDSKIEAEQPGVSARLFPPNGGAPEAEAGSFPNAVASSTSGCLPEDVVVPGDEPQSCA